jgi:ribosome-associated protein
MIPARCPVRARASRHPATWPAKSVVATGCVLLPPVVRKLEQYLADEAKREADDRNLVSRTEERREKQRIEAEWITLAKELTTLKPAQIQRLELTQLQLEILDEIRGIESAPARARAVKQLRGALRDLSLENFAQRVRALTDPQQKRIPDDAAVWSERLIGGSDADLTAFVEEFANADRAQMRTLVRNLKHAKELDRPRAQNKLTQVIRRAMQKTST